MAFKVDFGKFKKLSGDKNFTVMKHEDGHVLRIAHGPLSHSHRKQLEALPMHEDAYGGGDVSTQSTGIQTKVNPKLAASKEKAPKKDIPKFAGGGDSSLGPLPVADDDDDDDDRSPASTEPQDGIPASDQGYVPGLGFLSPFINGPHEKGGPQYYDPSTIAPPASAEPPSFQETPKYTGSGQVPPANPISQRQIANLGADTPAGAAIQAAEGEMPPAGTPGAGAAASLAQGKMNQAALDKGVAPGPQAVPANPPLQSSDISILGGTQQEANSLYNQGEIAKQQALRDASVKSGQIKAQMDLQNKWDDSGKAINDEIFNTLDDIKNFHINPQRFLGEPGSWGRMQVGLGLVLGGMGGGLTGGGNQALDFVNRQIDRDIDAQKAELGKKETLLSGYYKQFGNLRDATDMSRLIMSQMAQTQLEQSAAQAAGPMAQQKAQQLIGQLKQRNAMPQMQLQFRQMLANRGTTGDDQSDAQQNLQLLNAARRIDPEYAKDMASRSIPTPDGSGIEVGDLPIDAKDRSILVARQSLQHQIHDLRQWAQQHSGTLSPAEINEGNTKASLVQDAYRRANGQGVFREAEANFVQGIVKQNPTAFLNSIRVDPSYKALEDSNLAEINGLRQGMGLKPQGPEVGLSQVDRQYVNHARQVLQKNPNDKTALAVMKRAGFAGLQQ